MKLTDLFIYPIKSCQGISLTKAQITPRGLTDYQQAKIDDQKVTLYDRQFMLVDKKGNFITQRQYPQLATVLIEIKENNLYLNIENNSISTFELIPDNSKTKVKVKVWRDQTIAIDQGDEVAKWFQEALKLDICRLVKQSDEHIRPINSRYSTQRNQPVSFADGYPFLLTNTASLEDLRQRLNQKYTEEQVLCNMNLFRPNIVVETNEAFIEDTWKQIKIGNNEFAVVKPCTRCIITTTNQKTGQRNSLKEPLLTLSGFRNTQDGIMFGQNMIALNQNTLTLGDVLEVIKN